MYSGNFWSIASFKNLNKFSSDSNVGIAKNEKYMRPHSNENPNCQCTYLYSSTFIHYISLNSFFFF